MPKSVFSHEYRVFCELMRDLRIKSGLTQVQLSAALGMSQSFVSKYEMGERRLDIVEVDRICEMLGSNLIALVSAYRSRLVAMTKAVAKPQSRRGKR